MSNSGAGRSGIYWRQVKNSTFFKAGAVVASFLTLPYTIKFLGPESFGVWATMLTLISWVMLFDVGIGNSLKNKLAESLAQDDTVSASSFISTAYVVIGVVAIGLFVAFFFLSFYIPWHKVFNTSAIESGQLHLSVVLLILFICINFWLSLITQICHGLQKSAMTVLAQLVSNMLALLFVFVLYHFFESDLVLMVVCYGIALLSANIMLSYWMFREYNSLIPRLRLFSKDNVTGLINLGMRFFVIQIAVLAIFMTDKILITQLLGPAAVMPYEVLFKLFSVFTILHSLILVPLWPSYTDAYSRKDFAWIKAQIKRQLQIASALFIGAVIMIFAGPYITAVWIDDQFQVSFTTYLMFAVFIIITVWNNVFAYYVNAINKTDVQLVTALIGAILNVPLSIFLVRYADLGLDGIILSTVLCLSIYSFIGPYEVYKTLNSRVAV